jgi:hypothetical protein
VGDAVTRWILAALLPWVYGFSPDDPAWRACDRLDGRRGVPPAGTTWLMSDVTTWDALPGSMGVRFAAGREPKSRAGLSLAWRSVSWPDGAMNDLEGALVWRASRWRAECALGRLQFMDEHATRCSPRLLVAVSPHLVTGGSVAVFPESPGGAPEFEIEARASTGPWLLGLVLHENAGEAAVGIEARPGLTVIARYADDVPALGIVLDVSALEFRAEAEDHPLLGRIARVAVRWMRGRS